MMHNTLVNPMKNSIMLRFIDGDYVDSLSDTRLLPKNCLSFSDSGEMVLTIPENFIAPELIYVLFEGISIKQQQLNIIAESNCEAILVEERCHSREGGNPSGVTIPAAMDSPLRGNDLNISLKKNARVQYYKLQHDVLDAHSNFTVHQTQDSQFRAYFLSTQPIKETMQVHLTERGAECELYGLYLLNQDKQETCYHIQVDHLASHTKSTMQFKGILSKKSSAEFKGKVYVQKDTEHVEAHQENHNLLLTQDAKITTKPELEIYADDVKCTHGATIGQLDENALFYLRSRGIEKTEAYKLLTHAFAAEILSLVKHENIKAYVQKRMETHEEI